MMATAWSPHGTENHREGRHRLSARFTRRKKEKLWVCFLQSSCVASLRHSSACWQHCSLLPKRNVCQRKFLPVMSDNNGKRLFNSNSEQSHHGTNGCWLKWNHRHPHLGFGQVNLAQRSQPQLSKSRSWLEKCYFLSWSILGEWLPCHAPLLFSQMRASPSHLHSRLLLIIEDQHSKHTVIAGLMANLPVTLILGQDWPEMRPARKNCKRRNAAPPHRRWHKAPQKTVWLAQGPNEDADAETESE